MSNIIPVKIRRLNAALITMIKVLAWICSDMTFMIEVDLKIKNLLKWT